MSLEVTGTLIKFYDEKTFPSGFCVREFVIRTEEQYPQEIVLQATGNAQRRDKIDTLNKFNINDVKIDYDYIKNYYSAGSFVAKNICSSKMQL